MVSAAALAICAAPAALGASLYTGPGSRPGPAILYQPPAAAPQLTNTGVWHAPPILVSGGSAYRDGEFLYQDWLYDDHGARELPDPADPRASGDTFSKPDGTYTYPTGAGYANDAADLVEFRVKPLAAATAFRVTLNTLENPSLIAFSIAIGGVAGKTLSVPGRRERERAGVDVPDRPPVGLEARRRPRARVRRRSRPRAGAGGEGRPPPPPDRGRRPARRLESGRRHRPARDGRRAVEPVRRPLPAAGGDRERDAARRRRHGVEPAGFLQRRVPVEQPGAAAVRDRRIGRADRPAVVARRGAGHRARQRATSRSSTRTSTSPSSQHRVTDNSQIPTTGPINRILASHYEPAQGANFSSECGLQGSSNPASCKPEYDGQLEPYTVYVPRGRAPAGGWGLTLLLHSLSANYNQYTGTRNQSQFANRRVPSIVITPEARGPDQFYQGLGAAPTCSRSGPTSRGCTRLNPAYTDITGYSMGGMGTFKLGAAVPRSVRPRAADRRVRAQHRRARVDAQPARADVEQLGRRACQRQRLHPDRDEAREPRLPLRARRLPAVREHAVLSHCSPTISSSRSTTSSRLRPRSSEARRSTATRRTSRMSSTARGTTPSTGSTAITRTGSPG